MTVTPRDGKLVIMTALAVTPRYRCNVMLHVFAVSQLAAAYNNLLTEQSTLHSLTPQLSKHEYTLCYYAPAPRVGALSDDA